MKSNSKKFLAMFLAVLFVMSTMVTSAFATTDNVSIVMPKESSISPQTTAKCVFQKGGSLASGQLLNINFKGPMSGAGRLVVAAGNGGDLILEVFKNTTTGIELFGCTTINSNSSFNRSVTLSSTCQYLIQLVNTNQSPLAYSVLIFDN